MASGWMGSYLRYLAINMTYIGKICTICGESRDNTVCLHHVTTRKSGGTDDDFNLMPLCLKCHNEMHNKGLVSMSIKYLNVKKWLSVNGWKLCHFRGKWIHG